MSGRFSKAALVTALVWSCAVSSLPAEAGGCFSTVWSWIARGPDPSLLFSDDLARALPSIGPAALSPPVEKRNDIVIRYTGESAAGRYGGRRNVVRMDAEWRGEGPAEEFQRGGMQWNSELFGEVAAEFAGFGKKSENEWWDPDAAELNGPIRAYNEATQRPEDRVAITFYDAPRGALPAEDYLAHYGWKLALPKAAPGDHSLHDGNFHWASVAVPPFWHRLKAAQVRAQQRFARFLRDNAVDLSREGRFVRGFYSSSEELMNQSVDILTGRVMTNMNPSLRGQIRNNQTPYGKIALGALSNGASAEQVISRGKLFASGQLRRLIEEFIRHQRKTDPDFTLTLWDDPLLKEFKGREGTRDAYPMGPWEEEAAAKMTRIMTERIALIRRKMEELAR